MKTRILLFLTLLSFSGCIALDNKESFFERPSLRLNFEDQTKTVIGNIDNFTAIAFNDHYYDLHSHNLTLEDEFKEVLVLHGVPEDNYEVFIFTEQYEAVLDTLNYTITQKSSSESHDPIKVGDGEYYVRRANSSQMMVLKDLYVRFKIKINGALDLSSQNDFRLTLNNIPQEFDFYGDHSHDKVSTISPKLEYDRNSNIITTEFYSNKFCPNEDVTLSLDVKAKMVFRFNISHYLKEAAIDMSKDNIIIPITIDVSSGGTGILINGWRHILSYETEVGG